MSDEAINAKRYSAGIATAYGAAVKGGYTGTYAEFCAEQAKFAENAQVVREDRIVVENLVNSFGTETVPAAIQLIENAGAGQVQNVQNAAEAEIGDIEEAGDQQVGRIELAINPYVQQAEQAKDDAEAAQNAAEEAQGEAEASAEHAAASEEHAQELVDSLPSDYADLLQDIVKMKLLSEYVMDTTQKYTFSEDGKTITKVEHVNSGNVAVRTDVYTYGETQIVEKRTLSTGANVTITTNLTTLETSVVYATA